MGGRSARVFDSLTRQPDCQFVLGCEVSQTKLQTFQAANRPLAQISIVGDYRKVLDRNDVDAVLIATPDFSHSKIMVDAVADGEDVYVEKPISNSSRVSTSALDHAPLPSTSAQDRNHRFSKISADAPDSDATT